MRVKPGALCHHLAFLLLFFLLPLQAASPAGDWPDWRGPARDGVSSEKNLPTRWSPSGENLLWKAPYGGLSTPIVLGDHVYLQNSAGQGELLQERLLCFHADTGELLWEYRFNVYLSDVPPHRVGWASPVADPATGNIYVLGVGGTLLALSPQGKLIWERPLSEEFGLITTHGGRTVSPVIEGELVIVSGLSSGWGSQARGSHRFFAFDKKTGETLWVSQPGGRPFDTTYSPPIATVINGTRLLIAGGSDGAVHALMPQTGAPVWRYAISKRGINTGATLLGTTAIVSHGEENLGTSEMGMITAFDATVTGAVGPEQVRWSVRGFTGGYSSAVTDGERIYQIDNSANLVAFDPASGHQLWTVNLGTIQRASPVLADGKLYVGTQNGKFFILRPRADGADILDEDQLGTDGALEEIRASVAVSRGRVYLVSSNALYCIGKKSDAPVPARRSVESPAAQGPPATLLVVPTELMLKPGETIRFKARLFDSRDLFLGATDADWSLEQLTGSMQADGAFTASAEPKAQAGQVKATVGELTGAARVRVIPPLSWTEDFDSMDVGSAPRHWISAAGKYAVRQIDGNKVLVKKADNPFTKRARTYVGFSDASDYTVAVDVRATQRRRRMGNAGVIAQRYLMALFGSHQRLEIHSWQPETARTVSMPFSWKPDTWYRMKLRVENLPDGTVRARGKVWPKGEAEPAAWTLERIEPIPNRQGSPGIYADAFAEVFFDNLKITPNPEASNR